MPRNNAPGYQSLATKALRFLLLHGPATVAELAEEFGATEHCVRDSLRRLQKAGAVEPNEPGTVVKNKVWSPVLDADDMYTRRVRGSEPVLVKTPDTPKLAQRNWFDI